MSEARDALAFRLALPDDAERLCVLARACYVPWYAHLWHEGGMESYLGALYQPPRVRAELADANVRWEIASRDGRDVGHSKLEYRRDRPDLPDAAYLERVYVLPTAGRGAGSALIERALADARAAGRRHVWLRAMDSAAAPLARYRELGFRTIDRSAYAGEEMREEYRGMLVMAREL